MKIKTAICVLMLCAFACTPVKTAFAGSGLSTEVELIKESTPQAAVGPAASSAGATQNEKKNAGKTPVNAAGKSGAEAETGKTGGQTKTSSPATGDGRDAASYLLAMAVSAAAVIITRSRRSG